MSSAATVVGCIPIDSGPLKVVCWISLLCLCFFQYQGMETEKPGKMKMVMEKSWNIKTWPKFMEFCD